ncbi:MAG: hypothetical protein PHT28_04710, partial [Dehalococcoidales bacterium]|nr:hypothetical protein [Dehalococcoidales bacterium]
MIQQKGQTKAGKDVPCETCSDKPFCLATFQKDDTNESMAKRIVASTNSIVPAFLARITTPESLASIDSIPVPTLG